MERAAIEVLWDVADPVLEWFGACWYDCVRWPDSVTWFIGDDGE